MPTKRVPVIECSEEYILAENIRNSYGTVLAAQYSKITDFVKDKLLCQGILTVKVYYINQNKVGNRGDSYQKVKTSYTNTIAACKDLVSDMSAGKKIEYEKVLAICELIHSNINETSNLVMCLNAIQSSDEYTYIHCVNVSIYCMLIAKWMGLNDGDIKTAVQCGLLHDIGKSKIPHSILNKKGRLTKEEFAIMKKHTLYGLEILNNIDYMDEEVKRATVMHHERVDGSGYPYNTADQFISLFTKITAVADIYDAVTSNRVYRERKTPFEAFLILKTEEVCRLDTKVLNTFLNNIVHYYIGFSVLLNDGRTAKIVHIPLQAPHRPIIEVNGEYVDLSQNKNLEIVEMLPFE